MEKTESPTDNIMRIARDSQLSDYEARQLKIFEKKIEQGLKHFVAVGFALRAIRDERLYRASHNDFDSYLHDRWELSESRAKQFIVAAEVDEEVIKTATNCSQNPAGESETPIPNEGVARALSSVAEKGERKKVWEEAEKTAPTKHGKKKITSKHVKDTAAKMKAESAPAGPKAEKMKDRAGRAIQHDQLAVVFNCLPEFDSLAREISALKEKFRALADGKAGQLASGRVQIFNQEVGLLRSRIIESAPYAVCVYCGGDGCQKCGNRGWLNKDLYDVVPAELKGAK